MMISIADCQRILIIGNGGAGKTWLSQRLEAVLHLPVTHLDDIRWQPGNYGLARNNAEVIADVQTLSAADRWLMEGVYGWLAKVILPRTTLFIWADLPEAECLANIHQRGNQGGASPASFHELLEWVATYRTRGGSSCYQMHLELFDGFEGCKIRLQNRAQMTDFLQRMAPAQLS